MEKVKTELRILRVFGVFLMFMVEGVFSRFASNERKALMVSKYASRLLRVLQIRCHYQNTWGRVYPGLIVANHISYVDILVIAKLNPALFITSTEVRDTPGMGWLAKLAGCVFVERRSRLKLVDETLEIEKVLNSGSSVVLFPEGTSTRGDVVLSFHAALFQSAMNTRARVHNFYIQYDDDAVAYYGEDRFMDHLYRLCSRGPIWATLNYLGETKYEMDDDRKSIARMSYEKIIHTHTSRIRRDHADDRGMERAWGS